MPGVIVSDDFVYLHMPKTGGGTIRSVLSTVLPEGYATPGPHPHVHPGWQYIPPQASDLPVLCYIRNPWDWHVSWYMFGSSRREPKQTKLWSSAFADKPDFPTFLRRACTGALDHDRDEIAEQLRRGEDFYSVRLRDLVGGLGGDRLTYGRFERLFDDLEAFLRRVGAPVPDDFVAQAGDVPGVHIGRRGPYRDYYDDETRSLVAQTCSSVIERFGYTF
jgi:hypothetical protein